MKTKYPLLLVHGLGMKDCLLWRSFGRIDRILRIQGYQVYTSDVDAMGSIENNAAQLKAEIQNILSLTGAEKVNLIAHSKGGLDAKYMICHLGMANCVASLTTLCTPHRGSPVATGILRAPKILLGPVAVCVNGLFRLMGDKHPDSMTACRQLQRVQGELDFDTLLINEKVYCQSFSATMKRGRKKADFVMQIPLMFSRYMEKGVETDGLVPRDSAIFGVYRGDVMEDSVSHAEMVDFMVADKKRDKIYAFYSALCEELVQMGF